jgi:hypothetical protein
MKVEQPVNAHKPGIITNLSGQACGNLVSGPASAKSRTYRIELKVCLLHFRR